MKPRALDNFPAHTAATNRGLVPSSGEHVAMRTIDAPRELVWEVITDPEHLALWMHGVEGERLILCDIDLRQGGTCHYVWESKNGKHREMRATFREIVPQERLVSAESWNCDWPELVTTVTLRPADGKTILTRRTRYRQSSARRMQ